MDLGLTNKVAMVTGASRGLGRAMAHALADEGMHVSVCARTKNTLNEAVISGLANAVDAKRLLPEARLSLSEVRGQVTYLPASPARSLTGSAPPSASRRAIALPSSCATCPSGSWRSGGPFWPAPSSCR